MSDSTQGWTEQLDYLVLAVWFIFDSLQEKIDYFDSVYLKKRLMNEPDPIDAGLQDFYTKIVIKWVI